MPTTVIPHHRLDELRRRVAHLNRRAERLGLPALSLTAGDPYLASWPVSVEGRTVTVDAPAVEVQLVGDLPVLDGAELLAAVDWVDGRAVLRHAPTVEDAPRPDSPRCEHCALTRSRTQTAIIRRDGQTLQVGTTCLKDFLGHPDPAAAVAWVAAGATLLDDDDWADATGGPFVWRPLDLLARTAAAIREHGWTSRTAAREDSRRTATADLLGSADYQPTVDAEDRKVAQAALDWVAGHDGSTDPYLANLVAVLGPDATYVLPQHVGIACSAIAAHQRARQQEASAGQQAAPAPTGRVAVHGTVTRAYWKDDPYRRGGRPVWTVRSAEGWTVWGTVPSAALTGRTLDALEGCTVTFTATLTRAEDRDSFAFGKRPSNLTVDGDQP